MKCCSTKMCGHVVFVIEKSEDCLRLFVLLVSLYEEKKKT